MPKTEMESFFDKYRMRNVKERQTFQHSFSVATEGEYYSIQLKLWE